MELKLERYKGLAERLLRWNKIHLNHIATLSEEDIAEVFASNFVVKANGRVYEANHGNYKEFLDGFRRDIVAIEYDVQQIVCEDCSVVLAMKAKVLRICGREDVFEAMLLLTFDKEGKVSLWHEVYVQKDQ